MADEDMKPLTDEECQELMYLYRVVRADNERPGEVERLKSLLRRFELNKAKETP